MSNLISETYDNEGLVDLDITAARLGSTHHTMTREQIREYWGETSLRYQSDTTTEDIQHILKARVDELKQEDAQYIEIEVSLQEHLKRLQTRLTLVLSSSDVDKADFTIPPLHSYGVIDAYKRLASRFNLIEDVKDFDEFLAHRKVILKLIRKRLTKVAADRIAEQEEHAMTITQSRADRHVPGGKYQPRAMMEAGRKRENRPSINRPL